MLSFQKSLIVEQFQGNYLKCTEIQRAKFCSLLKLSNEGTKWKKRHRKFNNNKFSFKTRQKTYLKAQKCSKFRRLIVRIDYSRKSENVSFPTSFAVILSAVAFPIVLKAEFNFELIISERPMALGDRILKTRKLGQN